MSHIFSDSERKELESKHDYKKCNNCGEMKYIPNQGSYTFKIQKNGKTKWYCSYTCFRGATK